MATDPRTDSAISPAGLRFATLQDTLALSQLHALLDPSPWTEAQWRDCMGANYRCWVIELEHQLAGYALFHLLPDEVELLALGVAHQCQERGLGYAMLQAGLMGLPDRLRRCLLEVRRSNVPARDLYRKLGFQQIAVRSNYYPLAGGNREDALVLELLLPLN